MAGLLDAASGQLPDVEQSVLWLQSMEQEVGSCLEAAPVNLHAQRFAGGDASFADDRGGGVRAGAWFCWTLQRAFSPSSMRALTKMLSLCPSRRTPWLVASWTLTPC
jgi:hypothetical protein